MNNKNNNIFIMKYIKLKVKLNLFSYWYSVKYLYNLKVDMFNSKIKTSH